MKLYHFCGKQFVESILKNGLTKGIFPKVTKNGVDFVFARQWLTAEPDAEKQSWATQQELKYSRTGYRLTVDIPDEFMGNLIQSAEYVRTMPQVCRKIISDWTGSDKWYIYIGSIPSEWISSTYQNYTLEWRPMQRMKRHEK